MKKIIPFMMAVLMAIPILAQQNVILESVNDAVPGDFIEVPLIMENFTDVGAITLNIAFDGDLLKFQNFIPAIGEGSFEVNVLEGNRMILQWNYPLGKDINGLLGTFTFIYQGYFTGTLNFIEAICEITDPQGFAGNYNISYTGASIMQDPLLPADGIVEIGTADAIAGGNVLVPVSILDQGGLNNIAKNLILKVGYDSDKLTFVGIQSGLPNLDFSAQNGTLTITNFNLPNLTFDGSPLWHIEFQYFGGGDTSLEFLPGSIITDDQTNILVLDFINGGVNQSFLVEHGSLSIEQKATAGATIEDFLGEPLLVADPVSLAIEAEGLSDINNIGLVQLIISYDTERLEFTGPLSYPGWVIDSGTTGLLTLTKDNILGFTINDGTLFTLEFDYLYLGPYDPVNDYSDSKADVEFQVGTYLLKTDGTPVGPGLNDGWVMLYLPGDANCDGIVSASDIVTIVNYINGLNPMPFCFGNADTNNDGIISAQDIVNVVNIIQNQ